jgi:hypothetical protein
VYAGLWLTVNGSLTISSGQLVLNGGMTCQDLALPQTLLLTLLLLYGRFNSTASILVENGSTLRQVSPLAFNNVEGPTGTCCAVLPSIMMMMTGCCVL